MRRMENGIIGMKKIFEVICGLRYREGICRNTWNAYRTYNERSGNYVLWASRYNVVTHEDRPVALFSCNEYGKSKVLERRINRCNINMSIDELLEYIGTEVLR